MQRKLESLSNINPRARLLQRLLIGHATDLEFDANGRVLLPAMLRDYAGLEKKAVLVGQGNKIEIWAADNWHASMDRLAQRRRPGTARRCRRLHRIVRLVSA